MAHKCPEYDALRSEIEEVLENLRESAAAQLQAFRSGDNARFRALDDKIELTVGAKERIVGAIRQHAREHGCNPIPL